jgi:small subunit ribosomal protein S20
MANIKSAEKRNRQNERRKERNRAVRSSLRTQIKKMRSTIEEGDESAINEMLSKTFAVIDRSAKHNVIPGNRADRYKSRLALAARKRLEV